MAIRLTQAAVDAAIRSAGQSGERVTGFEGGSGLALRVRAGRASYVFAYRWRGRTKKLKLGDVGEIPLRGTAGRPGALELAQAAAGQLRNAIDPAAERQAERARRLTVAELLEAYLADLEQRADTGKRRGRRSSVAEFRRLADRAIVPHLGKLEVEALDAERVSRWHVRFAESPTTGNRAATVARAAYRFGQRHGIVAPGASPFEALVKFEESPKRERYSLPEIELIGAALRELKADDSLSPSAALAFRLLLLAGLRRSEVLGHSLEARRSEGDALQWRDVDLEAGLLRLRRAKAGAREVILSTPALEALRDARPEIAIAESPVCAGRGGAPLVGFEKAIRRVFDRAGVPWRGSHALRRTFASIAAEQGHGEFLIGALLGHRAATVTAGYVLAGADPLRAAAERIAGEIAAALDGTQATVLNFGQSKNRREG